MKFVGFLKRLQDLATFEALVSVCKWIPVGGTGSATNLGLTVSTLGTATARAPAPTNSLTRLNRIGYVSSSVAGSVCGLRTALYNMFLGDGSGFSSFIFSGDFGISDASLVSGARMFYGIINSTAQTNVDPATLVRCAGIAQLSSDSTQLYIVYGNDAAKTPIPLGADFPVSRSVAYSVCIAAHETQGAFISIKNLTTKKVFEVSLPIADVFYPNASVSYNFWRTNNATAAAVGLDVGGFGFFQE